MASLSRRARYHAQTKRENSLMRRELQKVTAERARTVSLLLMVLAQHGGSTIVTDETIQSVSAQISTGNLGYASDLDQVQKVLRVQLVARGDEQVVSAPPAKPLVTLTDEGAL
jgi:hypothetical protein